eukprot:TRINITY_DN8473_c0_g2_i1.p1 TRINITY_DN8473_c0_g2~~TRINITY_DN8473_c0_g2_i1.p1  ORF type:complete len:317 (-),score=116.06 TRINITY_DN8473_c0_g2_i1:114-1064(-)
MIRRPPRSTLSSSSAASDVYKRQVEKIIASIDEDDYEVLMAIENDKVKAKLSAPRPPSPKTASAPNPHPHPNPTASTVEETASTVEETVPAPPPIPIAQPMEKKTVGASPVREDSAARAAKRREEAEAVRQRVEADRQRRAGEARRLREQEPRREEVEARRGIAGTNQQITSTATSANVRVPEGETVNTPDDWAKSRGNLAQSPVESRKYSERQVEEKIATAVRIQDEADAADAAARAAAANQEAADAAAAAAREQEREAAARARADAAAAAARAQEERERQEKVRVETVSYTHLRAHETPEHLVCRLLLEKKKKD